MEEHTVQQEQLSQLSQPEHLEQSQSPIMMVLVCCSEGLYVFVWLVVLCLERDLVEL
jgi:hypothetical protein